MPNPMSVSDRPFWEGELYKLLSRNVTTCFTPRGQFSVAMFATRMGYSSEGLYKYLRSDRLTMNGAKAVMIAADGLISEEQLAPFMPFKFNSTKRD